ncbi:MAG: RdgB/HAM1 family non-canonical purine NTP pyrophosphatase [Hyphomonadaceae bacterium]
MSNQGPSGLEKGRVVIATHNPGKLVELQDLLVPLGYEVVSAGELGLPEPEETETTFEGNARLKALAAAQGAGFPALADDSGLSVDALAGAPGVYSARWAGPEKDFTVAMRKVNDALAEEADGEGDVDKRARFTCALALAWPDGRCEVFEGDVRGQIVWPPRGDRGFGYDPMFVPENETETFGEMEPARKHAMSHRAAAFAKFLNWINGNVNN